MSSQFNHILVAVDNSPASEKALKKAINLCKVFHAKITAVYIENHRSKHDSKEKANNLTTELSKTNGLEIAFTSASGKVFKEINRVADEVEADLIIIGTHGSSGKDEYWIGSVAFRVVSSAKVPVITIQENFEKQRFDKIVLPIDNSRQTRQKIPTAVAMANYFNSEVHLFLTSKHDNEESIQKVVQYGKQSNRILKDARIKTVAESKFGVNIAEATIAYSKSVDADLIIMMAESESSTGLFMGSYAQQLVNRSPIPVLTLHAKNLRKMGSVGY